MAIVPKKNPDRIKFYEDHAEPWGTNAAAIGTTSSDVADLNAKTAVARAAYTRQGVAQQSAKAATTALDVAMNAMQNAGASVIDQVRARARLAGDSVYALAEIPVPAIPGVKGNPGTPYDFKVAVLGDGRLELTFKCDNPAGTVGTIYQVYRRVGGEAGFSYVGGNGMRKFSDTSLPAGTTQVTYQVQAVRSTAVGDFAQFNVTFGIANGGAVTASVAETPMKIAA